MAALTEDRLLDWEISVPAGAYSCTVRAVYPTTDANLPGWTLWKDHHHKIVYAIFCADRLVIFKPIDRAADSDGAQR